MEARHNEEIARFMGHPLKDGQYHTPFGRYGRDGLKYHSEWSWLLPVVARINDLENGRLPLHVDKGVTFFSCLFFVMSEKTDGEGDDTPARFEWLSGAVPKTLDSPYKQGLLKGFMKYTCPSCPLRPGLLSIAPVVSKINKMAINGRRLEMGLSFQSVFLSFGRPEDYEDDREDHQTLNGKPVPEFFGFREIYVEGKDPAAQAALAVLVGFIKWFNGAVAGGCRHAYLCP